MLDTQHLALSADQARTARAYFAWSQAQMAEESGLPLHKVKRFEAGAGKSGVYIPDADFLGELRSFYEGRGYRFDDTPEPGAKAKESGLVFPEGVVAGTEPQDAAAGRPARTSFHHMRIALADPAMGHTLDLIEENEEKTAALLQQSVETGFFGGPTEQTAARHGEIVKLLAENGLLFAKLFGRDIGGAPAADVLAGDKTPATHAELLHRLLSDAHLAAAGDADARARRKSPKPASTLFATFFG
ncbi:MAG TPA: hypothetical protein VLI72_09270 [Methylibium sp.]|nr:hypothetical protein [Methylibium sp.]